MRTKILSITLIGMFALMLSSWTSMNTGATTTPFNMYQDYNETVFNPCTGEDVVFTGTVHIHGNTTITPSGSFHMSYHQNLQGVSGIGVTTGNAYNYVGVYNTHFNGNVGVTITDSFHAKMVSNGDQYNQLFQVHITVNANGELTVFNFNAGMECQ